MTGNLMKFFLTLMGVMFLFSCQDIREVEKPNDLIPEQKMVEVLTDLSLINSAKNYNRRMLEATGLRPNEYLYEKHNIDSLQLARSTEYYANNPDQLQRIYSEIQENLEEMQEKLEVIREEKERMKDSLLLLEKEYDSLIVDPELLEESIDSLRPVRENQREYQN